MKAAKKWLYALAAALLVTAVIGLGALQRVDRWAQDAICQQPGVPSPEIIIIGIDEEALTALGPYQTWDRNIMAAALEALAADPENKPAVTCVDILYAGSTDPAADERLAAAAANLGNVVTASMAEFEDRITWQNGHAVALETAATNLVQPYDGLRQCTIQGHINVMADTDGILRHSLLYVETGSGRVYSMAAEAARYYLSRKGETLQLPPASASGQIYVPFSGHPGAYSDGVSLNWLLNGEVPPEYWAGRIVLIGPYAPAMQDAYFTAMDKGEQMNGVEFQANLIQSLLEGRCLTEVPDRPQLAVLFALCLAAAFLFLRLKVGPGGAVCLGLVLLGIGGAWGLSRLGYVTHVLWIPAGVLILYILAILLHYLQAARERQALALEKERLDTELDLATRIQESAIPQQFPAFPEQTAFDICASMKPAREVGGDLYDFFMIDPDHLCVVIGDVSGKGIPASLLMMVAIALIHHVAMTEQSPAKILQSVNNEICIRNPEEMFVTVWLGVLELSTGRLTAANAGHEYPALKQAGEGFEILKDRHGFVLGGMSGVKYREYELQLQPGAKIFVYSDGVPEAQNTEKAFFGTERMLAALQQNENGTPQEILAAVDRTIRDFVGSEPPFDDLTMLCLQYNGKNG